MESFLNLIPDQLNYIKNTEVSTQTNQQIKRNIQSFTASSNQLAIIRSAKENDKNQKKLNINKLNRKTCDKTYVNENSNNEERGSMDQDDEKCA